MTKKQIINAEEEGAVVRAEVRLSRLALRFVSADALEETLSDLAADILADKVADDDASIEKWLEARKALNDLWSRVSSSPTWDE